MDLLCSPMTFEELEKTLTFILNKQSWRRFIRLSLQHSQTPRFSLDPNDSFSLFSASLLFNLHQEGLISTRRPKEQTYSLEESTHENGTVFYLLRQYNLPTREGLKAMDQQSHAERRKLARRQCLTVATSVACIVAGVALAATGFGLPVGILILGKALTVLAGVLSVVGLNVFMNRLNKKPEKKPLIFPVREAKVKIFCPLKEKEETRPTPLSHLNPRVDLALPSIPPAPTIQTRLETAQNEMKDPERFPEYYADGNSTGSASSISISSAEGSTHAFSRGDSTLPEPPIGKTPSPVEDLQRSPSQSELGLPLQLQSRTATVLLPTPSCSSSSKLVSGELHTPSPRRLVTTSLALAVHS